MSNQKPVIYVFFGMIASGKSTLAAAWAHKLGLAHLNSDVVRKQLAGLPPSSRAAEGFEAGIFSPEFSRKTYDALLASAADEIRAGRSVVLDASYGKMDERNRIRQLAAACKTDVRFILCSCPEEETERRLALRAKDPEAVSDGRREIYLVQKTTFQPPVELAGEALISIDSTEEPALLVKRLEELCNIG